MKLTVWGQTDIKQIKCETAPLSALKKQRAMGVASGGLDSLVKATESGN